MDKDYEAVEAVHVSITVLKCNLSGCKKCAVLSWQSMAFLSGE